MNEVVVVQWSDSDIKAGILFYYHQLLVERDTVKDHHVATPDSLAWFI